MPKYLIGSFLVDKDLQSVHFENTELCLSQNKCFEVLCILIKNYHRYVSREELIEQVWQGNFYVGEKGVTNTIWLLRKAFSEFDNTEYISTKRGLGYRLVVEPKVISEKNKKVTFFAITMLTLVSTVSLAYFSHKILFVDGSQPKIINVIAKLNGKVGEVEFSPNINWLTFAWKKPGERNEIYALDLKSTNILRKVTDGPGEKHSPAWIDSGKGIAYIDIENENCVIKAKELSATQTSSIDYCSPDINTYVSSNSTGNKLIYNKVDEKSGKSRVFIKELNSAKAPFMIRCNSENCNYEDKFAVFSLNDEFVFLERRYNLTSEQIVSVHLSSGKEVVLTHSESDLKGITYHIDDNIYFSSEKSGKYLGYKVIASGGEPESLGIENFSAPSSSRVENEIFFTHKKIHKYVSFINLEHSNPIKETLLNSDVSQYEGHYSSATKKLAFISGKSGYNEIWISEMDGGKEEQLTFLESDIRSLSWSPNGEKIAFLVQAQNSKINKIMIFNLNTGLINEFKNTNVSYGIPSWSEDGRNLIVSSTSLKRTQLESLSLVDNKIDTLSEQPVVKAQYLNNNTIIFSSYDDHQLWLAKINNNGSLDNSIPLLKSDGLASHFSWYATEEGIYYLILAKHSIDVKYHSFHAGKSRYITSLPKGSVDLFSNISYSQEFNRLILTSIREEFTEIGRIAL